MRGKAWIPAFAGMTLIAVLLAACNDGGVKIDKSPAMQKSREKLIKTLMQEGVIAKVDYSTITPRIWVRPIFLTIDFQHKQNIAAIIFAHHFDDGTSTANFVRIVNAQTGKEIGTYRPVRGLRLD